MEIPYDDFFVEKRMSLQTRWWPCQKALSWQKPIISQASGTVALGLGVSSSCFVSDATIAGHAPESFIIHPQDVRHKANNTPQTLKPEPQTFTTPNPKNHNIVWPGAGEWTLVRTGACFLPSCGVILCRCLRGGGNACGKVYKGDVKSS